MESPFAVLRLLRASPGTGTEGWLVCPTMTRSSLEAPQTCCFPSSTVCFLGLRCIATQNPGLGECEVLCKVTPHSQLPGSQEEGPKGARERLMFCSSFS